MKTFNKILSYSLLFSSVLLLPSCKDNILTPVANNKSADSLTALINTLNSKLVSVNANDNTLQIQIAKFQSKADSLKAVATSGGNYSQLVEYTVYVIDGGNSVTGINYFDRVSSCKDCKAAGVDGATVTVYSNGQTYTAVSADGRAIFNNLYVAGLATVTVSASGYTKCSYTTYFNPKGSSNGGGISSVSLYSSNFSGYASTANNVSPSSTNGSGSGAMFNFVVGNSGNVTSITVTNPGVGYQNGDLITFSGGQICDCSGSLTYSVSTASGGISNSGGTINASTNVLIVPTAGKNVTTYTGQLYINKSVMDDTLGRLYNNQSTPAAKLQYKTFISPNGPYHGNNNTYNYTGLTEYTQNQYSTIPSGTSIRFDNVTTLSGVNFFYGYPSNLNTYYNANNVNYQYLPGDIISISYTGVTSFASIDGTGKYTMNVPSYQNNPGTTIGAAAGLQYGNRGNLIHYQDSCTFLSTTNYPKSSHPTLKYFDPTSYVVTPITTFYAVTKLFDFYPFIELDDNNGYGYIGGGGGYTQNFYSNPGQTINRNIFFFAIYPTGQ